MTSQRIVTGPEDPILNEILEAEQVIDREAQPVFIVGCTRSGTSALSAGLTEGAGVDGLKDGGFLPLMQRMLDEVNWHYSTLAESYVNDKQGNLIANTAREIVESQVTNWFAATYAREMPKGPFIDRNVETVRGAPLVRSLPRLAQLYPEAKFIFVARRSVDCIHSCFERSPGTPIQHFAWIWQDTIDAWGKVRAELGDRALEVYQHEMALEPEETAGRVAGFLGLKDAAQAGLAQHLASHRPGQDHFAGEYRTVALDETLWKPHQRKLVQDITGTMTEGAKFSFASESRAPTARIPLFLPTTLKVCGHRNFPSQDSLVSEGPNVLRFGPPAGGQPPAEFRYLKVPFVGVNRFSSTLSVPEGDGRPVVCRVRIEKHEGHEVVRRLQRIVKAGETVDWAESFDALPEGWYDVILAVMTEGEGAPSPVRWIDGAFAIAP